eukprot:scaffold60852_cov63-Phaeocystis_antarctica.AAC.1
MSERSHGSARRHSTTCRHPMRAAASSLMRKRPRVEIVASTGSRRRKMNLLSAPPASRLAQLFCFELGLMVADVRHFFPDGKDICPPQRLGPRTVLDPFPKPR